MSSVLHVYKPIGVTPLQAIDRLRALFPKYSDKKIGYAGRLDPMAEGVLVLLVDEENRRRSFYEELEKDYSFSVLFGASTDTYDVMGEIVSLCLECGKEASRNIFQVVPEFCGEVVQKYPPYSSAVYRGKPLYYWARKGKLPKHLPSKKIFVHDISFVSSSALTLAEVVENVCKRIEGVKGDFRQERIVRGWRALLDKESEKSLVIVSNLTVTCSSGTYVRSIADALGKRLLCPSLAYSIVRTRVGSFSCENAVRLW